MYVCVSITCKSVHVVANGPPQVLLRSCLPCVLRQGLSFGPKLEN